MLKNEIQPAGHRLQDFRQNIDGVPLIGDYRDTGEFTRLGRENEARSVLEEMMRGYPEFPAEAGLSN